MKFGPVPVGEAEGAILAHAAKLPAGPAGKRACCFKRRHSGAAGGGFLRKSSSPARSAVICWRMRQLPGLLQQSIAIT